MQIRSPKEIANAADAAGKVKANLTSNNAFSAKFIGMSFAAGAFIALGGLLSVVAGYGFPEASAGNPSLQKMLSGLVFPIGLVLVVVLGAELFTGNNALLIPGMMRRDIRPSAVLKNWGAGHGILPYIPGRDNRLRPLPQRHNPDGRDKSHIALVGDIRPRDRGKLVCMPGSMACNGR